MKARPSSGTSHETYFRTEEPMALPGNKSFGFVFAGFFTVVSLIAAWRSGWQSRTTLICLGLAALFLLTALTFPGLLAPLNRVWMRFGLLLHRITTPLLLGLVFFLVVTPLGWLAKAVGQDFLRLRRPPGAKSYWIERPQTGSTAETLRRQF